MFNRITTVLIIINIITFTLQNLGFNLIDTLGLRNISSEFYKPYQLFTHTFIHANFMHLFNNIFAIYIFGPIIENTLGNKTFLKFYIATAIGAAAIYSTANHITTNKNKNKLNTYINAPSPEKFENYLEKFSNTKQNIKIYNFTKQFYKNRNNKQYIEQSKKITQHIYLNKVNTPVVGASGIVFGLMTAFAMLFPNKRIFLLLLPIPIKAKYFVAIYALYEIYSTIKHSQQDNVAHIAHIGGVIIAFIFIKIYMKKNSTPHY